MNIINSTRNSNKTVYLIIISKLQHLSSSKVNPDRKYWADTFQTYRGIEGMNFILSISRSAWQALLAVNIPIWK